MSNAYKTETTRGASSKLTNAEQREAAGKWERLNLLARDILAKIPELKITAPNVDSSLFDWKPQVQYCIDRRSVDVAKGLKELSDNLHDIFRDPIAARTFVVETLQFLDGLRSKPVVCHGCGSMALERICGACRRSIASKGELPNGSPKNTTQEAYLKQFSVEMIRRANKAVLIKNGPKTSSKNFNLSKQLKMNAQPVKNADSCLFKWKPCVQYCVNRRSAEVADGLKVLSDELQDIFRDPVGAQTFVVKTLPFLDGSRSKPVVCNGCGSMALEGICGACRLFIVTKGNPLNVCPRAIPSLLPAPQEAYLELFSVEMIKRAKKRVLIRNGHKATKIQKVLRGWLVRNALGKACRPDKVS